MSRKTVLFVLLAVAFMMTCFCNPVAAEKMTKISKLEVKVDLGDDIHPAFKSLLLGKGNPITYRAKVEPGGKYIVVVGAIETYWREARSRDMVTLIEGADNIQMDPANDAGKNKPAIYSKVGQDADNNGWLKLQTNVVFNSPDRNPVLSGIWIFEQKVWQEKNLTIEMVLRGKADNWAKYFVDCGSEGSENIEIRDEIDISKICEEKLEVLTAKIGMLKAVSKPTDSNLLDGIIEDISPLAGELKAIEEYYKQGKFDEFLGKVEAFTKQISEYQDGIKNNILKKLAPVPVYQKPTRTIMMNPYTGMAFIEQHDKITFNLSLHPKPTSQNSIYHGWNEYRRKNIFGQIEISTDSQLSKLSTALELDYHLGLTSVDYDPLETYIRYLDGMVSFKILDGPGFLVSAKGNKINVGFDAQKAMSEGNFWYKKQVIEDQVVYCGILFDSEEISQVPVSCDKCVIFWADSLRELREYAQEFGDFKAAQTKANQWAVDNLDNFKLEGYPSSMVHQVDISKKALLSMQFISGGIYAAPDNNYDGIWVRDGAIAVIFPALAGMPGYLEKWTPYIMANPQEAKWKGKTYEAYLSFPFRSNQKWEQDGTFYAVLSAYSHWKLTGDDSRLEQWYQTLRGTLEFMDTVSFDEEMGLYCEWYINEAPLQKAVDNNRAISTPHPAMKIDGVLPEYICTIYVNNIMYSAHLMLAEMAEEINKPDDAQMLMKKAYKLNQMIDKHLCDEKNDRYIPGIARFKDRPNVAVDWNYWDIYFDYIWAFTLHPQCSDLRKAYNSIDDMLNQRNGIFPGLDKKLYFSPARPHASYFYSAFGEFDKTRIMLQRITERAMDVNPEMPENIIYAMRYAIPERVDTVTGHRPQTFTAGPYLQGAASMAFLIDYHGVTVCPSENIVNAMNISFRKTGLDIYPQYSDNIAGIILDTSKIRHTLKIPSSQLKDGKHTVKILESEKKVSPVLEYSCFELKKVQPLSTKVKYWMYGYGNGMLRFDSDVRKDMVAVKDASGKRIDFEFWKSENSSFIQLVAGGEFTASVSKSK